MHPEEIKSAMRMKGTTPAALADELQVTKTSISLVISGRSTSARIAKRISEIIGKQVDVIWPPRKNLALRRIKKSAVA